MMGQCQQAAPPYPPLLSYLEASLQIVNLIYIYSNTYCIKHFSFNFTRLLQFTKNRCYRFNDFLRKYGITSNYSPYIDIIHSALSKYFLLQAMPEKPLSLDIVSRYTQVSLAFLKLVSHFLQLHNSVKPQFSEQTYWEYI